MSGPYAAGEPPDLESGGGSISANLQALDDLADTGYIVKTGVDTWAGRTFQQPASGITLTDADGILGNTQISLANDLLAIEQLSTTGLAVRSALDTWTTRSIAGTSNRISLSNGDGISGNPTIDISASYVGQSSITTVGTIGSGTWNGSAIADAYVASAATWNSKQAGDSTLTALAAYNTNGLITQTAADTFTGRTITGPAAGISISNGSGVSGNPTISLSNDLAALEGLSSTGLAARTTTDTWAQRSIAGTSNRISITNGDGVSGNPAIDISSSYVGQSSITTLGTIGTGVWQGTAIGDTYISSASTWNSKQTGDTTLTALAAYNTNGLLTQTAADTFTGRTVTGTTNEITVTNGSGVSGNPTLSLPSAITLTGKTMTGGTYASAAFNGTLGVSTPDTASITILATSGAITTTKNANSVIYNSVVNNNAGANADAAWTADNGTASIRFGMWGHGASTYNGITADSGYIYIGNSAGFELLSDGGGEIRFQHGATKVLGIPTTGITVTGTASISGHITMEGVTSTGAQGTGAIVFSNTPTLTTPVIGAATGTSVVLSASAKADSFKTVDRATISAVVSGVPTLLFTPSTLGVYLIWAYYVGASNPVGGFEILFCDGASSFPANASSQRFNMATIDVNISGTGAYVTQSSGSNKDIIWGYLKLA